MPIVEVTHDPQIAAARLRTLAEVLPHAVSLAVKCPEEPYDGMLQPGDVDVRFRPRGLYDSGDLDVVVEVRSKWFASRADSGQERCDRLRDAVVEAAGTNAVGVYLSLPVAAWAQGE
ncbi:MULTISPECIES: hypothetical protein [unclassified Nocardioides]|uniref:hypothetical protein n=1 Tax=unclassified Nocardioides TaxID=2615069 RepID=UPI0009F05871|nr:MULTISPECIES: hypothetical protein [unclassified Nocardioides]GAW51267.1 predicted protein [Nocardioides sp. PD653-B2]GAW52614.1 predicted protein [Nocardioides sp. PD653]